MGAGASTALADATAAQLGRMAAELSEEDRQKLRQAVKMIETWQVESSGGWMGSDGFSLLSL